MEQTRIKVFQTHIEIYPYRLGQSPELELKLSRKDKPTHSLIPIGYYYDEGHDKLFIPRGINLYYLQDLFHTKPEFDKNNIEYEPLRRGEMTDKPRNDLQCNAIDFLMQVGPFTNTQSYTQLGLNLPTGTGKTFCTIHALVTQRHRAIIICHNKKIREQWVHGFEKHTNLDYRKVLLIDDTKTLDELLKDEKDPLDYDYFIMLHQTLTYYANANDWYDVKKLIERMQVYTKVIDEAHLYFENSLMIDYFTNVPMTYYLTATFGRSDPQENFIYKMAFSRCFRFGDEVKVEPHVRVMVLMINSNPTSQDKKNVEHATAYGFSAANYMKYEMEEHDEMMDAIEYALKSTEKLEGIRLVTSGLIKSVEDIRDKAKELYPDWNCVAVHTKRSDVTSEDLEEADMISATTKYIGTGGDIRGLRVLISTESMGSRLNVEQLLGRLRPYRDKNGNQLDTVMFYIVDSGFRSCIDRYQKILPTLERLSKSIALKRL